MRRNCRLAALLVGAPSCSWPDAAARDRGCGRCHPYRRCRVGPGTGTDAPVKRCRLMTRFRSEAMTCAAAPVRSWHAVDASARFAPRSIPRRRSRRSATCKCPGQTGGRGRVRTCDRSGVNGWAASHGASTSNNSAGVVRCSSPRAPYSTAVRTTIGSTPARGEAVRSTAHPAGDADALRRRTPAHQPPTAGRATPPPVTVHACTGPPAVSGTTS